MEEVLYLRRCAQADEIEGRQSLGVAPACVSIVTKGEQEQRVAAEEDVPDRLAVRSPQLLAPEHACERAPHEAREPDPHRLVEPDNDVCVTEDEVPELALVRAVDHPGLRADERLDR